MEEKRSEEVAPEQESAIEVPDENRRDFVAKLVTAAGMVAVAGLAGAASGETSKTEKEQIVKQKVGKLRNGFTMTFSGKPIGEAMVAAGIAPASADIRNARLTIEFTA